MITLKKLERNMDILRPFIKRYGGVFNDFTLGTRYMWDDEFKIEYAVVSDTLIMRETFSRRSAFYYPLGEDISAALNAIEEYSKEAGTPLCFGGLTEEQAGELSKRYAGAKYEYSRDWCDYIYPVEQFKTYAGKKLSGQRNHVNKFKKLYPDHKVNRITANDLPRIKEFLREYEKENEFNGLAAEEEPRVYALLENMAYLEQFGIFITVGDKIVSLSVGEKIGDVLYVHVEKGLKEYEGVYPATAQAFAREFADERVKYINREEDCGDLGLRVSKTQYHPSLIAPKYHIKAPLSYSLVAPFKEVKTERLTITDITADDKEVYAALYSDDELNRFYGYDYREDLGDNNPDGDYFFGFMQSLKDKKQEYSLAVRLSGEMIGEIVFYDFGYRKNAEIGFRFFKEYQGKGYAFESVKAAINHAFHRGIKVITCRHFKENVRSERLINKLGFIFTREDETHKYYELTK
ncbi:MAG: GNAT family N-acetyltransferase [Clostridia bacterium]|nr:GNAT family N-acetyltransferase [Clostridia bacterium]